MTHCSPRYFSFPLHSLYNKTLHSLYNKILNLISRSLHITKNIYPSLKNTNNIILSTESLSTLKLTFQNAVTAKTHKYFFISLCSNNLFLENARARNTAGTEALQIFSARPMQIRRPVQICPCTTKEQR